MNLLHSTLSEICSTHKLREKILIVPSFFQGHQITESLVKNGIPYINLRIKTITSLAHETIDLDLVKDGSLPPKSDLLLPYAELRESPGRPYNQACPITSFGVVRTQIARYALRDQIPRGDLHRSTLFLLHGQPSQRDRLTLHGNF
jgi:hypothetical protein